MDKLLGILRAAGEPTRLRIIGLLGHGELTVTELTQILGQSQPRVSRHLKLLSEAGLLSRFQEGTWAFYRLTEDEEAFYLARTLVDLIPGDDPIHTRDLERLSMIRGARAKQAAEYFRANAADWNRIRSLYVPEEDVEQHLLEALKGKKIDTLLDIGTGTGRILEIFSPHIERGLGIDLSREMLSVARAMLAEKHITNCQVRLGDMYSIPVGNASQDAVIFHQVLHFADDPESALREAGRVLKEGGALLIVDFAPHEMEFLREQHAHRRLGFGAKEIAAYAKEADLKEISTIPLAGGKLTVNIWRFEKKRAAKKSRNSLKVVK
ncbi:MAG: metalloregulator ArsR/SmtB family transcription factor [Proteobacteria bacterium]|nr:metalloregulator ArsR/SmtB family transcription factor [Pseudomonadota bacterium]MCH8322895.1 metalloregulator ArsR/SmtB family transcription factor [Pseudomonadota bacterium]